jgi:hypothetical protein
LICAVLLGFTVGTGVVAVCQIERMNGRLHAISADSLPAVFSLARTEGLAKDIRGKMRSYIVADKISEKRQNEAQFGNLEQQLVTELQQYSSFVNDDSERMLWSQTQPAYQQMTEVWNGEVYPKAQNPAGKEEALSLFTKVFLPRFEDFNQRLDRLVTWKKAQTNEYAVSAMQVGSAAEGWVTLLILCSVVCGGLLSFFVVRGANRSLRTSVAELEHQAQSLKEAVLQIAQAGRSVEQGAMAQMKSIAETTSSSLQIADTINHNAGSAQAAAERMDHLAVQVGQANQELDDVLRAMREARLSNENIVRIIRVIEQIAVQTNLLALNAAVQAAHAGDEGLGFGVVAGEIRNLAQRTAEAAKETTGIVGEVSERFRTSSERIEQIATVMGQTTGKASEVKQLIDEVESRGHAQAREARAISSAMENVEQVARANAASAEQSSRTAEALDQQVRRLSELVNVLDW